MLMYIFACYWSSGGKRWPVSRKHHCRYCKVGVIVRSHNSVQYDNAETELNPQSQTPDVHIRDPNQELAVARKQSTQRTRHLLVHT